MVTLKRHMKRECEFRGKPPPFACTFCDRRSTQKSNVIRHVKSLHKEEYTYYKENKMLDSVVLKDETSDSDHNEETSTAITTKNYSPLPTEIAIHTSSVKNRKIRVKKRATHFEMRSRDTLKSSIPISLPDKFKQYYNLSK